MKDHIIDLKFSSIYNYYKIIVKRNNSRDYNFKPIR